MGGFVPSVTKFMNAYNINDLVIVSCSTLITNSERFVCHNGQSPTAAHLTYIYYTTTNNNANNNYNHTYLNRILISQLSVWHLCFVSLRRALITLSNLSIGAFYISNVKNLGTNTFPWQFVDLSVLFNFVWVLLCAIYVGELIISPSCLNFSSYYILYIDNFPHFCENNLFTFSCVFILFPYDQRWLGKFFTSENPSLLLFR